MDSKYNSCINDQVVITFEKSDFLKTIKAYIANKTGTMEKLIQKALSVYRNKDISVKLKARFLFFMCLTILVVIPLMMTYTSWLHLKNPIYDYSINYRVILPQFFAFIAILIITALLLAGYFRIAVHSLLVVSFTVLWIVMFADESFIVSRLDTIVIAVALMSLLPLAASKRGQAPFVYGVCNIVMLYFFMFYFRQELALPAHSLADYLADNTMAFLFIMIASYNTIRINNTSLDIAEKLNSELSHKNYELEATNEELAAIVEELEATNEEFEAQNQELLESRDALASSREELIAIFNSSHDGMIIFDEKGMISDANKRAWEMFGVTEELITSMNIDELSDPVADSRYRDDMLKDVLAGETRIFEWKARQAENGISIDLEVALNRFKRNGSFFILASLRDITMRKQIEESIKESERKYRLITENSTDVIFTMDRDFHLTYITPSVETVLGYPASAAMLLSVDDIFTDKSLPLVKKTIEYTQQNFDSINPEDVLTLELEMYRHDGSAIWTLHKYTFLKDEQDKIIGIAGVAGDITERKKAEDEREHMQVQLLQAQKMEAIGTLAGGIAHDFNNILGGVMGSLNLIEILLKDDEMINKDELKNYIATAVNSTARAADITRQLLTLSRKNEPQRALMDVKLSLRNICQVCNNSFPKSVSISVDLPEEDIYMHGDISQIEQVFLNLCLNASHAMTFMRPEGDKQGGVIKVTAEKVVCDEELKSKHPEAEMNHPYIKIVTSDTGIGMDEYVKKQIFDPFYTTKKFEKGTGLGLAMVYAIVSKHSGFIELFSEPGSGSVFTIYLPGVKEIEGDVFNSENPDKLVKGEGLLLVVDDEKAMLKVAGDILKQCGYEVLTASNGDDAIRIFEEKQSGITGVLLDLAMPGITGIEVLESIKKINPEVKVIIVSGFIDEESMKAAAEKGAAGFLKKPFTAVELSVKMKNLSETRLPNQR